MERKQSRNVLLKILGIIRYLAKQSSSLQGDWQEKEKREVDSNFWQLLKLRCEDDPTIMGWLEKNNLTIHEKSVGTTELHYSMKKRYHVLGILQAYFRPTLVRV